MTRKDILIAAALILFTAVIIYFQSRDTKPSTPEEALQAVLAKIDGQIKLDELPLEQAIKQVRGNGELILVSFEDPNCIYCIKLNKSLRLLDNITLYTFLTPMLSDDSVTKSRRIWCAPDPVAAWNNWMLEHRPPSGTGDCDVTALDRNLELGDEIGIQGVPYLLRAK